MIFTIDQTNDGRLFIGSLDGGIDAYDYRTNRVSRNVVNVDGDVYILRNSKEEDALYIGTDGNGVKKLDLRAARCGGGREGVQSIAGQGARHPYRPSGQSVARGVPEGRYHGASRQSRLYG